MAPQLGRSTDSSGDVQRSAEAHRRLPWMIWIRQQRPKLMASRQPSLSESPELRYQVKVADEETSIILVMTSF